jgi:lysophospholipase L1-like esterase
MPVLVCCGDSNLHGTLSASITPEIVPQLCESLGMEPPSPRYATFNAPLWVINCAQNCLSSQTVLQERLSTALNCHPDYILVMIGTNDVLCMYHGEKSLVTKHICSINQLDDTAGHQKSLERNISGILNHIYQASPRVQIGLATLPPMGENLTSPANQLVRQANEVIERAAASFAGPKENISIIPVYSSLEAILEKSKTNRRKAALLLSSVDYFIPISIWMCYMYYIPIFTGWMTWNKLATVVGNSVMSDGIHLSEKGRDVIVELIVDWLNKKNIAKAIAVKSM